MGFTLDQSEVLGEKLILKNYLVTRNYELERLLKEYRDKCANQAQVIEALQSTVAKVEWKERLAGDLQASYKEYFDRYKRLYEAEERKKKIWRTVAAVTTGIAVATTTTLLITK